MKHFFLAALILSSTAAHAFLGGNGAFGTGIQIDGGGTFGWLLFQTESIVAEELGEPTPDINFFDHYPIQLAEGGTVGIGYGFCWCERFRFTPQFDAYFLASNAPLKAAFAQDSEDNFFHRHRCNTLLDLSIKPGVVVADCLLVEFKAGVSWAHIEQDLKIVNDDDLSEIQASSSGEKWPVGYTLGAAARIGLTRCLSGFLAFDWHAYHSGPRVRVVETVEEYMATTTTKKLSAKTFSFGLTWSL